MPSIGETGGPETKTAVEPPGAKSRGGSPRVMICSFVPIVGAGCSGVYRRMESRRISLSSWEVRGSEVSGEDCQYNQKTKEIAHTLCLRDGGSRCQRAVGSQRVLEDGSHALGVLGRGEHWEGSSVWGENKADITYPSAQSRKNLCPPICACFER